MLGVENDGEKALDVRPELIQQPDLLVSKFTYSTCEQISSIGNWDAIIYL